VAIQTIARSVTVTVVTRTTMHPDTLRKVAVAVQAVTFLPLAYALWKLGQPRLAICQVAYLITTFLIFV
jgi:hypothetical protein